jgi:hypothetical protein
MKQISEDPWEDPREDPRLIVENLILSSVNGPMILTKNKSV